MVIVPGTTFSSTQVKKGHENSSAPSHLLALAPIRHLRTPLREATAVGLLTPE